MVLTNCTTYILGIGTKLCIRPLLQNWDARNQIGLGIYISVMVNMVFNSLLGFSKINQ